MILNKKLFTALCAVLFITLLTCCTSKKQVDEPAQEKMSLSAADTTKVKNLMQQYFDLLINKDFDGAMSMVSQLRNDSLTDMTPELQKHYQTALKLITPIRYELESMAFESETDCLVRYSAVLFDKESDEDNRPNKMFYAIKPVRINGEWYLTVADKDDLNTRDSNININ